MAKWSHLYPDWAASDHGGSTPVLDDGVGDGALFDTIDDLDDDDDDDDDDPGEVELLSGVDEDDDDEEGD